MWLNCCFDEHAHTTDIVVHIAFIMTCVAYTPKVVETICRSLGLDENAALNGLMDFHHRVGGAGDTPRHFSDDVVTGIEHRPLTQKMYDVPRWLETVIDARGSLRVGTTAKAMTVIGALVKPSLVRKVTRSPTPKNKAHADVSCAQRVVTVRRSFLNDEETILQRAVERIMASSTRTGFYALTIIGSGLIGAVDGCVLAPWTLYSEWKEPKILSREGSFMYRLLSGIDYGTERFRSESGEEQAPWIELDRQILIVRSMLSNLRVKDRGRLREWYISALASLLTWAGDCSWVKYEIEAGEIARAEDAIDVGVAMYHLDRMLDRAESSYKNTFGVGGKHARG